MISSETKLSFLNKVAHMSDATAMKVRQLLISELMQDGMDATVACDAVSRMTIQLDDSLDDVFLTQLSERYAAHLLKIWGATYLLVKSLVSGTSETARISRIVDVIFLNSMWNRHLILLENLEIVD